MAEKRGKGTFDHRNNTSVGGTLISGDLGSGRGYFDSFAKDFAAGFATEIIGPNAAKIGKETKELEEEKEEEEDEE